MRCPQCGSENIQMQSQPGKSLPIVAFILIFGGLGLMFLSVLGAIIGVLLGWLVGAIAKAIVPQKSTTIAVCQSCGFTSSPANLQAVQSTIAPTMQKDSACNLTISRRSASTGSAINLCVKIDDRPPLILSDGAFRSIELEAGNHQIAYEQKGGLGKANRCGTIHLTVEPDARYALSFMFTANGLDVSKSW